jgi:hypothetical protein
MPKKVGYFTLLEKTFFLTVLISLWLPLYLRLKLGLNLG